MIDEDSLRENAATRVREELQELKARTASGRFVEINPAGYRIWIGGRGEHLFYQDGERALFAVISLSRAVVSESSLDYWDDGTSLTDDERQQALQRIVEYFSRVQHMEIKVIP